MWEKKEEVEFALTEWLKTLNLCCVIASRPAEPLRREEHAWSDRKKNQT
jgi:hypothetical protein